MEAAQAWLGKLGSELRHGTGKLVLNVQGDGVDIAGVVVVVASEGSQM